MVNPRDDDFTQFFQEVTGFPPFLWQTRMAAAALAGYWPDQINLPTGVGKSSLVVIWAYALAKDFREPKRPRNTPLRLIYVVDRRLVVDAVDEQARSLAQILERPQTPTVQRLADALRPYAGAPPIHVERVRGGVPHNALWANAPRQPAIVTTTVDQAGSRLLFRGYGISAKQRPIHAGLLGVDSLFVVDEAHLSTPFVQTLRAIRHAQDRREQRVGLRPLKVVAMSATLNAVEESRAFTLRAEETEELADRLARPKWMTLQSSVNQDQFFQKTSDLRKNIQMHLQRITTELESGLGAIIVNHVATARAIFEDLQKQHASGAQAFGKIQDVILLTGRTRPYDRDAVLDRWLDRMRAHREEYHQEGVLWLVATQTVEVGADLDFDALITECAPLSAIQQRLGRLNRLGRRQYGVGVVVRPEHAKGIYSDQSLRATWDWLRGSARSGNPSRVATPVGTDAVTIDGAFTALSAAMVDAPPRGVEDPPLDAPVLQLPHLEAWTQTEPAPTWEPDITPFLHGKQNRSAEVHVVWRQDFTEDLLVTASQDRRVAQEISDFLAWVPPTPRESIDLPIWAVRKWLQGEVAGSLIADVGGDVLDASDASAKAGATERLAWRWEGNQSAAVPPNKIRPGDTIIVPSAYGGVDSWGINWVTPTVNDLGDCAGPAEGRRHLRLTRTLLAQGVDPALAGDVPWIDAWEALLALFMADDASTSDRREALEAWLGMVLPMAKGTLQTPMKECLSHLDTVSWYPYPESLGQGMVILWYLPANSPRLELSDPLDDEATNCLGDHPARELPTLREHQDAVAAWIRLYAEPGVIPQTLAKIVGLSGQYHDLGKLDPRFQMMMHGGDAIAATAATEPVAKSHLDPRDRETRDRARRLAAYPTGQRHEELSVRLLQSTALDDGIQPMLPLLWHLVGSHHGWGRPWFPMPIDPDPVTIDTVYADHRLSATSETVLGTLDSGWVDQFDQLQAQYGYWGLAYLEAVLRCADYQASAIQGGPK